MKKYRISTQAINDLNDIWLFTFRKWSKAQADRYYQQIIDEIEFVAKNFYAGKSLEHARHNYRYSPVKSHLVFYRKAEGEVVEIVRILHQRMDVKKHID